jgi:hypothetical protein
MNNGGSDGGVLVIGIMVVTGKEGQQFRMRKEICIQSRYTMYVEISSYYEGDGRVTARRASYRTRGEKREGREREQ